MASKLFKRLGIALTGMALAIGVGVGLSQRGEYKEAMAAVEVSENPISSLADGTYVATVYASSTVYYMTGINGNNKLDITALGETLLSDISDDYYITVKEIDTGKYALAYGTTPVYIGYSSSTNFSTSTDEPDSSDTKFLWTADYSGGNNKGFSFRNVGDNTRYIKYYSTTPDLRAYTSSNGAVAYFRLYSYSVPGDIVVTDVSISGDASSSGGIKNETTIQLNATVTYDPEHDEGDGSVRWTTSNSSLATVNSSGLVTLVGNGTVTITATSKEDENVFDTHEITISGLKGTAETPFTVSEAITKCNSIGSVAQGTYYVRGLYGGKQGNYSNTFYMVDNDGDAKTFLVYRATLKDGIRETLLDELRDGTDTITISGNLKKYNETPEFDTGCQLISYSAPASSISISYNSLDLVIGDDDVILNSTISPAHTTDTKTWESSNPAVATVDENGRVHALTQGQTIVSVKSSNYVSAQSTPDLIKTCTVNCSEPKVLDHIEISGEGKTEYFEGDLFDPSGFVVTAFYEGEIEGRVVTASATWTPNGQLSSSDKKAYVSYTENGNTENSSVDITVTPVSVSTLSWTNRFSETSLEVIAGTKINANSFGTITATYNNHTQQNPHQVSLSASDCDVVLAKNGQADKPVSFDGEGNYTVQQNDDGYNFKLSYNGVSAQNITATTTLSVIERLNSIAKPIKKDGVSVTYNAVQNDVIKTSSSGTITASNNSNDSISLNFSRNAYFQWSGTSSAHVIGDGGDSSIVISTSGFDQRINSITVNCASNGGKYDGSLTIAVGSTTYMNAEAVTGTTCTDHTASNINAKGDITVTLSTSKYVVFKSITINYDLDTTLEIANSSIDAQKVVLEFANYFLTQLDDVCVTANYSSNEFSTQWNLVKTKYNSLITNNSKGLNEDDLTLAKEMIANATAKWADGDTLQRAMARYETIVNHSNLDNFIQNERPVNMNLVSNNPITVGDNSAILIIVILAMISSVIIGGYFFIRRRKER